jgi:hypothetical protein
MEFDHDPADSLTAVAAVKIGRLNSTGDLAL